MKLEIGDEFRITYFAKKHDKTITRKGVWTEKCREWVSQAFKTIEKPFPKILIDYTHYVFSTNTPFSWK